MNTEHFYCFYVDHSFFSAKKIGELYAKQSNEFKKLAPKEVSALLLTCQRIEIYSLKNENFLSSYNLPFKTIRGFLPAKNRLVSIASGICSQIIAEKNIYEQVKKCSENITDCTPIKKLFEHSLNEALRYRNDFNFYAKMNYEDFALHFLGNSNTIENPTTLVIVGSGMLAQGILYTTNIFKNPSFSEK